ncbi:MULTISPECIES: DHH family phosphoesterase [unclassified Coleofasciculus]|uniref:DHH family phosphoesterase n=1 Tax=unclassified Coleofasciculus TaxID=2692782 RepID=UPI00187ECBCD|nr:MULTISPECIES: phosphoesterase [unclassified Coleofasciculus]MBE9128253.1 phosphoesterase [Coleofasciculus sp. LEGE 07081]MBE9148575.1 phosphoesterase [Coleofasciculus sp. LEGE 07092]
MTHSKIYILYHANCYDGFGAAWAAWKALNNQADYIPVKHGEPPPQLEPGSTVYILDFSYNRFTLEKMGKQVQQVTVLDHHKTAQEALAVFESKNLETFLLNKNAVRATFDMEKSGAILSWEYFHSQTVPPPEFLLYIQDRDLWQFKLEDSREVTSALRAYPLEFQVWDELANAEGITTLRTEGKIILKLTNQIVERICKQVQWREIGGYRIPCVNATVFCSEVGNRLCQLYPDAPFSAYYLDGKNGKRHWGLRSVGDFDVSAIAKQYGGGGHKNAAGFVESF